MVRDPQHYFFKRPVSFGGPGGGPIHPERLNLFLFGKTATTIIRSRIYNQIQRRPSCERQRNDLVPNSGGTGVVVECAAFHSFFII